jgi:hypothetical protein
MLPKDVGHSESANEMLSKFLKGSLEGTKDQRKSAVTTKAAKKRSDLHWLHPLVDDLYLQPVTIVVLFFCLSAAFWAFYGGAAQFHIAMLPLYYMGAFSSVMFFTRLGKID